MGNKFLLVLEISQKQAYIFESNKLVDNINNSAEIEYVTSPKYFTEKCSKLFCEEKNLVYVGGGHSVLEFNTKEEAQDFAKIITLSIRKEYRGLEAFVKIRQYDEKLNPSKNVEELIKELEQKKAIRKATFKQGSFGIEKLNSSTFKLQTVNDTENQSQGISNVTKNGYKLVTKFEELGGTEGESNFIAVVHIDGNLMGKRVTEFREKLINDCNWENFKSMSKKFCEAIDRDFKNSYEEMLDEVIKNIEKGVLQELSLQAHKLPIRRVITAGDDICFVSEGRIGIECARIFIEKLWNKVNEVDGKNYSACAGVAMVHQKFPFYRAYQLAEELCSSAKKMIAGLNKDNNNIGVNVSAIDWHIEFGEMKDSLSDVREMYNTSDKSRLELRPYIICGEEKYINNEKIRNYFKFKKMINSIKDKEGKIARGKLKTLRSILKQGEDATKYYIKSNRLEDFALNPINEIFNNLDNIKINDCSEGLSREVFVKTDDGKNRCLIYDAIELIDSYIGLE